MPFDSYLRNHEVEPPVEASSVLRSSANSGGTSETPWTIEKMSAVIFDIPQPFSPHRPNRERLAHRKTGTFTFLSSLTIAARRNLKPHLTPKEDYCLWDMQHFKRVVGTAET
jgi:hypothetical protein